LRAGKYFLPKPSKIAQKPSEGLEFQAFLLRKKKITKSSQIYEKQTVSIENGFIEKQFSVQNQF